MARYYDANTRRFLLVGPGGGSYAIHRELWGPGVTSPAEAADHVNALLAERIRDAGLGRAPSMVDLGCGVGGTVLRLAADFPHARMLGVTLSGRQVQLAERLAAKRGLEGRCRFVHGDFDRVDLGTGHDAAVAVESFVHGPRPDPFFEAAARALRSGGVLILVDDFLARRLTDLDSRARTLVDDFRRGWRVPGLATPGAVAGAATAAGFRGVEDVDLTPLVRLGRPRDRVIALVAPLARWLRLSGMPFFGNMIGGDALQRGLRAGVLEYRMQVYRKA